MFKIKNKKSQLLVEKGMTLIEVMAVIVIIGIMSAISIVSFTSSKRSTELETAAEEITAVLREAQNYSLTGKNLKSGCNTYEVDFNPNSADFRLHNGLGSCELNELYSLKNGVTVQVPGNTSFLSPHATVASGATRTVIQKGGSFYTICVNTSGLVKKISGSVLCP